MKLLGLEPSRNRRVDKYG